MRRVPRVGWGICLGLGVYNAACGIHCGDDVSRGAKQSSGSLCQGDAGSGERRCEQAMPPEPAPRSSGSHASAGLGGEGAVHSSRETAAASAGAPSGWALADAPVLPPVRVVVAPHARVAPAWGPSTPSGGQQHGENGEPVGNLTPSQRQLKAGARTSGSAPPPAAVVRERASTHDEEAAVNSGGLLASALSALSAYFKPPPAQRHGGGGGGRVHAPGSPVRQQLQHEDGTGGAAALTAPGSPGGSSSLHSGKTLVACCSDGTLHVWRCGSGTCERSVQGAHRGRIHAVCCLPPAQCVTAGDDATLRVWHVKSGTVLHVLEGHMAAVRCCCALQCGTRVVSGADDRSVCVWDVTSGAVVRTMEGHTGAVVACCTLVAGSSSAGAGGEGSKEGAAWRQWGEDRVVTASVDTSLRVWDTATGRCEYVLLHGGEAPASAVRCCASLPDGHIVSGHDDGAVRVWHLPHWAGSPTHGALAAALMAGGCGVDSAASPVPHALAATTPDGAHIVSPDRALRPAHEAPCTCVCLVSDSRLASGGADGSVRLFALRDLGCVAVLSAAGGPSRAPVTSLATLHDGRFAVGAGTAVALWADAALGTTAAVFADHGGAVTCVAHIESTKANTRGPGAAGSRALCGFDRLC